MAGEAALVLAAHGSADPRFAEVIDALAGLVADARPTVEVRVGYLDHGPPLETVAADAPCVVVPVLLTRGFHVRVDIPRRTTGPVAAAVGPDRRLAAVLTARLLDAGWAGEQPVVLGAAGSADPDALADVHRTAADLGDRLGVAVDAGFLGSGEPRLADTGAAAVASYLIAPGRFADQLAGCGAAIVAAPLGADPVIAEIILDRYDAAHP